VVLDLLRHARRLEPVLGAAEGLVRAEEMALVLEKAETLYRDPWPESPPTFLDPGRAREVVRDGAEELRRAWLGSGGSSP